MGQQQLLLLVLGIVIVGLAVTVGLSAFEEHTRKAQIDTYTEEAVRLASRALAWKASAEASGGGQNAYAMTGLTLTTLGYDNVTPRDCGNGACQEARTSLGTHVFLWDQNSAYPHMGIADQSYDADGSLLDVAVFVYGPTENCLRTRVRTRAAAGDPWTVSQVPDGDATQPTPSCENPW